MTDAGNSPSENKFVNYKRLKMEIKKIDTPYPTMK